MRPFQDQYNFPMNNTGFLLLRNHAIQGRKNQMIINNFTAVLIYIYVPMVLWLYEEESKYSIRFYFEKKFQ